MATESNQVEKSKTDSDRIRHTTLQQYVSAQSKPNGNGIKGFFKSNLFGVLVLWLLSQAGFVISFYYRTSQLLEWKGEVASILKRMDDQGTVHEQTNDKIQDRVDKQQDKDFATVEPRLKEVEKDTRELPLMKATDVQLLRDVEELKHGRK